jgi:hypothetical protein
MFDKEFGFMEKRFVFKNPESSSGAPGSISESLEETTSETAELMDETKDYREAQINPFDYLESHKSIDREPSDPQMIAIRVALTTLLTGQTFENEATETRPLAPGDLGIETNIIPHSADRTTESEQNEIANFDLSTLELAILRVRIAAGQNINTDSLKIDSTLVEAVLKLHEQKVTPDLYECVENLNSCIIPNEESKGYTVKGLSGEFMTITAATDALRSAISRMKAIDEGRKSMLDQILSEKRDELTSDSAIIERSRRVKRKLLKTGMGRLNVNNYDRYLNEIADTSKVFLSGDTMKIDNITLNLSEKSGVSGAQLDRGNSKLSANEIYLTWDTPGPDNATIHYVRSENNPENWIPGGYHDDWEDKPKRVSKLEWRFPSREMKQ